MSSREEGINREQFLGFGQLGRDGYIQLYKWSNGKIADKRAPTRQQLSRQLTTNFVNG